MNDPEFLATCLKIFVIGALGIMSPGPDFVLILQSSLNYSKEKALMCALGIHLGLCLHIGLNIFGVGLLLQGLPGFAKTLPIIGALYLMWLGIKSLVSKSAKSNPDSVVLTRKQNISFKAAFIKGFLCNILKYKAMLFFLSIFTLIIHHNTTMGQRLTYGGILLGQSLVYWPGLVFILQNHRVENILAKFQNALNKILGVILLGFGIEILLTL